MPEKESNIDTHDNYLDWTNTVKIRFNDTENVIDLTNLNYPVKHTLNY